MKYGLSLYYRLLLAFQTMPIAATISTSKGTVLALHGGLGPSTKTIADIEAIDRFVEPTTDGPLCDILWADPGRNDDDSEEEEEEDDDDGNDDIGDDDSGDDDCTSARRRKRRFRPNDVRGCSYFFSEGAAREFLKRNDLLCLVRAHEVQESGFQNHFDRGERGARKRK